MASDAKEFRRVLKEAGLSTAIIEAAWPDWWCDEAEASPSARAELKFSLARKLGLDPRSLLDEGEPSFVWRDEAKFKGLNAEDEKQRAAIESFGISIAQNIIAATPASRFSLVGQSAQTIRQSILAYQPFVSLTDLIATCWAIGVPVIYLRLFPLSAKRMCAMSVQVGDRFAILLGKDAEYPAPIAYYLAHELGHIARGHLSDQSSVIDLGDPLETRERWDDEEIEADQFALELLTGRAKPVIKTETKRYTADQLSAHLREISKEYAIEPGTLALCFGHSTDDWPRAMAAMKEMYEKPISVWTQVNGIAEKELDWEELSDDISAYVHAVMGGSAGDKRRDRQ